MPAALLHALRGVLPNAAAHTPYGMTEALPVTDVALAEIDAAGPGNGVCVGRPLPGVDVAVIPLTTDGELTREPGVTGEISVAAPHVKDRYDQLWAVQRRSAREAGRHRTGDVGHLDAEGRLWVEGRLVHVVDTAAGPVTPVGIEQRVEAVDGIASAAVVGVGPAGTQQVVVVVVAEPGIAARRTGAPLLAVAPLTSAVRAVAGACRWRRCWSPTHCPSTSGTRRRSTARGWRRGRAGCWRASGRGGGRDRPCTPRRPCTPVHGSCTGASTAARAHRDARHARRSCTPHAPVHIARGVHEPGGVCTGGNGAGERGRRAANGWTR